VNVSNNAILARNRQLPDDDRMIEICQSILKSFNVNNLSVCIGWCADQVPPYQILSKSEGKYTKMRVILCNTSTSRNS